MNLLRFSDLKERGIVRNWPSLKRWVETIGFPPGRMLSPNTRVWTEAEIEEWLASRPTKREQHGIYAGLAGTGRRSE
jgi:hypothetical protein